MTRRMKFLFIHQNFPGQFVHVAGALARQGHEVVALGIKGLNLGQQLLFTHSMGFSQS